VQAREAATRQLPLLIVGEAGVGKVALARGVHQDSRSGARFAVVNCEVDAPGALIDTIDREPTPGLTVVLRHVDRLPAERIAQMSTLLNDFLRQHPQPWVVATVGSAAATPNDLLRLFEATVTVPPLRHRIDDLDQLITSLLNRLAPGRAAQCSDDAKRVLARNAWIGNVAELNEVLAAALRRRPAGAIRREDLPPSCFTTSRRALSPIERLERDAIVRALAEGGGNRKSAAAKLGMSRSSLYRKMHAFGITSVHVRSE
jgi:transcriptional regulator of acetoin/glycerol metabolism